MPNESLTTRLLKKACLLWATGFGIGLVTQRFGPGTWGSVLAFVLMLAVPFFSIHQNDLIANPLTWIVWQTLFLLSLPTVTIAEKALGQKDSSIIVIDEILAVFLLLMFVQFSWMNWLVAFALFRFFDIFKPFPINWAEKKVKGSLGVMLDDCLAVVWVLAIFNGLQWFGLGVWFVDGLRF